MMPFKQGIELQVNLQESLIFSQTRNFRRIVKTCSMSSIMEGNCSAVFNPKDIGYSFKCKKALSVSPFNIWKNWPIVFILKTSLTQEESSGRTLYHSATGRYSWWWLNHESWRRMVWIVYPFVNILYRKITNHLTSCFLFVINLFF